MSIYKPSSNDWVAIPAKKRPALATAAVTFVALACLAAVAGLVAADITRNQEHERAIRAGAGQYVFDERSRERSFEYGPVVVEQPEVPTPRPPADMFRGKVRHDGKEIIGRIPTP